LCRQSLAVVTFITPRGRNSKSNLRARQSLTQIVEGSFFMDAKIKRSARTTPIGSTATKPRPSGPPRESRPPEILKPGSGRHVLSGFQQQGLGVHGEAGVPRPMSRWCHFVSTSDAVWWRWTAILAPCPPPFLAGLVFLAQYYILLTAPALILAETGVAITVRVGLR
jgi:hypothetical protein